MAEAVRLVPRTDALIGRDDDLARAVDTLDRGGVVLVDGEAGVGKSRFARECTAATAPSRPLVAACQPYRQRLTLAAVVDALRERIADPRQLALSPLCGALRPLFPEWSDRLPPAPAEATGWQLTQHQTLRAIAELLTASGVDLLVIEDAHWAEPATIDLLLHLTGSAQHVPVLVTYRGDEVGPDSPLRLLVSRFASRADVQELTLRPLDRADTGALVSALLDNASVSAAFADFVHGRTGGMPLAIEEAVRVMVQRLDIAWVDGAWVRRNLRELDVPMGVREVVVGALRELDEPTRALAEAAAVLGEAENPQTVAAVAGVSSDAHAGLTELVDRGLLAADSGGRVGWRHALTGLAALETVRGARRVELHRRAAEVLAARAVPPVDRLTRHCRDAGLVSEACDYAGRAADAALGAGDVATAVAVVHDVLTSLPVNPADGLLLLNRIPLWGLVERADIEALLVRLRGWLADADSDATRAEVRFHLSRMLIALDRISEAFDELALAVDDLDGEPELQARSLAILSTARDPDWPADRTRRWRERAIALLPQLDDVVRFDVELDVVSASISCADEMAWRRSLELSAESTAPRMAGPSVRCNLNIGDLAMRWGDAAVSEQRLALARTQAADLELVRLHYLAVETTALLRYHEGRYAEARRYLAQAQEHAGALPEAMRETAIVATLLTRVEATDADATTRLRDLAAAARADYNYADASLAGGAFARDTLATDPAAVLAVTTPIVDDVERAGLWLCGVEIGAEHVAALVRAGDRVEAERFAAALAACTDSSPGLVAAAAEARAAVTDDPADAAEHYGRAAEAWRAAAREPRALRALEHRADRLRGAGEPEAAVEQYRLVLTGFAELGADAAVARIGAALRALGVSPGSAWRGGRRGYGGELSPREREVVQLVAAGATNRQIADKLTRSPKTISTQLQSAMRKLGVTTRTAAAVRAIELGLVDD